MSARLGVLRGVSQRRVVTTKRCAARLTGAQMKPCGADLPTLVALPPLCQVECRNRSDVIAGFFSHVVPLFLGYWMNECPFFPYQVPHKI